MADTVTFEAGRLRATSRDGWPALRRALMSMTLIPTDKVPTAAIDEFYRVYYNPTWFAKLTAIQAAAVAVHEVWHPLRFHFLRSRHIGVRPETAYLANLLQDAEIHEGNNRLLEVLKSIPDAAPVTRESFDPPLHAGGTFETWWHEVLRRPTTQMMRDAQGRQHMVAPINGRVPTPEELSSAVGGMDGSGATGLPAAWELQPPGCKDADGNPVPRGINAQRAGVIQRSVAEEIRQRSHARGTQEAGALRWANDIIDPQIDWRVAVQVAFQGVMSPVHGHDSWTYKRSSRRTPFDPRIVLPGWVAYVPRVAVIIDTSGSMSDQMLSMCRAEVSSLLSTLVRNAARPFVKVYTCDAAAHAAQQVWAGGEINMYGGGGTDLRVAFELARKDMYEWQSQYDIVICMTDGYTPWPEDYPVPVLTVLMSEVVEVPAWLNTDPHKTVRIDVKAMHQG